jgi:6-phosphogluconolactonase
MCLKKFYVVVSLLFCSWVVPASAAGYVVYVGSYTDAPSTSKGIYAWRIANGSVDPKPIGLVAETINPAYLAVSPNEKYLYAVNWQTPDAKKSDTVSAYQVDPLTSALTLLNRVSSGGGLPNAMAIDPSGRIALVVNYGFHGASLTQNNSSLAALAVSADGRLSEPFYIDHHTQMTDPIKPGGAHTHGVIFSHDGRFAFVAELGLDRVYSYHVNPTASEVSPSDPAFIPTTTGSGPRRMALSPSGRYLYVNRQDDSKVSVFRVEGAALTEIQAISTLPANFVGRNATAEVKLDAEGRFLYVSNRGHDSVAVFSVDRISGLLTIRGISPSLGKSPRNIAFDPGGKHLFVANQDSDNVVIFDVDGQSGALTPTGRSLSLSQPAAMTFIQAADQVVR